MLLAALLAVFLASGGRAQTLPSPHIVVEGQGAVTAAPDMATVVLGVEHQAKTARLAMDALNADLARVLERLRAEGIAPKDMQTSGLALYSRTDSYGSGRPAKGDLVAQSDITVRVRDLDRLGQILDAVVDDGANLFRGLTFDVEESGPLLDEARRLAVGEARRKAALYAEAAGVTLGPLRTLSEQSRGRGAPMMRMEAASDSVPIASGELTFAVGVTLTYDLTGN